jgi:hypothetical protein
LLGIAYFSASNNVCCTTRKPYEVFNPEKLVGSLQLRANEQQDAQECVILMFIIDRPLIASHRFSKLFITHLDDEFKKQPDSAH